MELAWASSEAGSTYLINLHPEQVAAALLVAVVVVTEAMGPGSSLSFVPLEQTVGKRSPMKTFAH